MLRAGRGVIDAVDKSLKHCLRSDTSIRLPNRGKHNEVGGFPLARSDIFGSGCLDFCRSRPLRLSKTIPRHVMNPLQFESVVTDELESKYRNALSLHVPQ